MLGLDFGTTRTKAAYMDAAGKPNIVLNEWGEPYTPTAIYFNTKGNHLIGRDAVEQACLDPTYFIRNFKLKLGSLDSLLSNGQSVTPTEAAAILIKNVKEMVEKQLGIKMEECVVTCPANFRDDSKQALKEACEQCGLKVLRLLPEPTAAGYAYSLNKSSDRIYAVYDFGGGTFDVSIQKIQGNQITTLATEGVPKLGGNDFNECIKKRLLQDIQKKLRTIPDPQKDALFYLDLERRIEEAKMSLNNRPKVPIVISYNGQQIIYEITQDQFHKDIDPLIQLSLEAYNRALQAANLSSSQIDHLIMVGGTSRMKYVQERVADVTGLYPKTDVDPDKAIAYGAAYACIAEMARDGKTASIRGQVIPAPEMFYRDVTAHSVGCCVADSSKSGQRLINAVIIPKNTPIPCQRYDQFFLENENQTEACIEILQGDENVERDQCLLIGELVLKNLPKETTRSSRIRVEYTIDANGMVTATATDKVSGQQKSVSVDYKKGVKPKDKPNVI